jgi:hypothetical protein
LLQTKHVSFFGMKLFLVLMKCYSLAMQPEETSM